MKKNDSMEEGKSESALKTNNIDKSLDEKRFTIREAWIISSTVVVAAIGLATAIIYKDAELKTKMSELETNVKNIADNNLRQDNEIRDMRQFINQISLNLLNHRHE